jgi:hypothetical protein
MTKLPKLGDSVSWGTPQGRTHGTVEKIVTAPVRVGGHTARARQDHPEVLVKSAKSGKPVVHKPEELKQA